MKTLEKSEDQVDSTATEDLNQETGFVGIPRVEHAAAMIAVPDPS